MASVQCRGREMVIEMFQNRNVDAWSIFQGKQYLFKGMGEAELDAVLDMIMRSASNSMYTLRVYEGITNPTDIKEKTPYDGSFNFTLAGAIGNDTQSINARIGLIQQTIEKKVAEKIDKMMSEEDNEKEPPSKLGMIGEILDHPVLGNILEKIALAFIEKNMTAAPAATGQHTATAIPMKAVGNITTDTELTKALEKLKQYDSKLTDHLKKLAILAEKDRATFNIIINSLENMQLE